MIFPKTITKHYSKPAKIIFFAGISLLLIFSSISANQAFATHLSDEIKWQLLFVTGQGCSLHNYQLMNQYDQLTAKYLELYVLENSKYKPTCLSEDEYLEYDVPHDLDLSIIVYDKNLGERHLHSQKMGGLYSHQGVDRSYNHVIIICDCSNFYYSDPVWILSHELSHFVLYYRDYDMSVIEKMIHANDAKYDACLEGGGNCSAYVQKIQIESSTKSFSVMPIYNPENVQAGKDEAKLDEVQKTVIGLSKMITKWWASDKIGDGDYANAVGFLVESKALNNNPNSQVIFADDPLDDQVTWEEKFKEINSQYRGVSDEKKEEGSLTSLEQKKSTEQAVLGIPDWFKTTALWWSQEKITDDEFRKNIQFLVKAGIIRPHAYDVFEKIVDVEESLLGLSLEKLSNDIPSGLDKKSLNALKNDIQNAKKQFDFGDTKNGCLSLDLFIEKVMEYIDTQRVDEKQGQPLINSADLVKLNFCES